MAYEAIVEAYKSGDFKNINFGLLFLFGPVSIKKHIHLAIEHGQLKFVKHHIKYLEESDNDTIWQSDILNFYKIAIRHDHLEIVKYLEIKFGGSFTTEFLFNLAVERNSFKICEWLIKKCKPWIFDESLIVALQNRAYEIAYLLIDNGSNASIITSDIYDVIIRRGVLEHFKHLSEINPKFADFENYVFTGFYTHLMECKICDVHKWFINKFGDRINYENVFFHFLTFNQINICRWLVKNHKIKINYDNDILYKIARRDDNDEMALFILNVYKQQDIRYPRRHNKLIAKYKKQRMDFIEIIDIIKEMHSNNYLYDHKIFEIELKSYLFYKT